MIYKLYACYTIHFKYPLFYHHLNTHSYHTIHKFVLELLLLLVYYSLSQYLHSHSYSLFYKDKLPILLFSHSLNYSLISEFTLKWIFFWM